VNPIEYGSYENEELLRKALEKGFEWNVKDKKGKTPYEYAKEQKSGVLRAVFEEFGAKKEVEEEKKGEDEEMKLEDMVGNNPARVDFEKDAHEYLHSI